MSNKIALWKPIPLPALLAATQEPRDLEEIRLGYPALVTFVEQRPWASRQDLSFASALVARVPTILSLGSDWGRQLVHLLHDLKLTLDHDRVTSARAVAAAVGLKAKVFALVDPGQREVANARGVRWRLIPLQDERRLLPLEVIDRCAAFQEELHARGDEADGWAVAHQQAVSPVRSDPILLAAFGRWLLEVARWREQ